MRLLFVHQNFPGQYCHIIQALAAKGGMQIVGLGINPLTEALPKGVYYKRYQPRRGNTPNIHPWILDTETKCIRGEACATAAAELKQQGFEPELICAHPGWGESLFLRDIWPKTPLLSYQEFFYQPEGFDYGFDPEFSSGPLNWEQKAKIQMKTSFMRLVLEASSWNVTPTAFQRSSFPQSWQKHISCLHDGINTVLATPSTNSDAVMLPNGAVISNQTPLVTFVNRVIEPYRGCHTFIRSIPALQRAHPKVEIVIIGNSTGDGYGPPPVDGTWKDRFLKEIDGTYDPTKVHFIGKIDHSNYLNILQKSWVPCIPHDSICTELEPAGSNELWLLCCWIRHRPSAGSNPTPPKWSTHGLLRSRSSSPNYMLPTGRSIVGSNAWPSCQSNH